MNAMAADIASPIWFEVAKLDDIPRRGARQLQLEKLGEPLKIAVFRTADDRVFALEDRCPHKNGPLSQGIVHDVCVTCPLHNWVISLESGEATGADEGKVLRYPVKLEGDSVLLSLNSEAEAYES